MIRHFIKLGIRNLNKNRGSTLISVLSLSLGIAILLVISIFACNELSVDNFHQNASIQFNGLISEASTKKMAPFIPITGD